MGDIVIKNKKKNMKEKLLNSPLECLQPRDLHPIYN